MKRKISIVILCLNLVLLSLWLSMVIANVAKAEKSEPVTLKSRVEALEMEVQQHELTISNLESYMNFVLSYAYTDMILQPVYVELDELWLAVGRNQRRYEEILENCCDD